MKKASFAIIVLALLTVFSSCTQISHNKGNKISVQLPSFTENKTNRQIVVPSSLYFKISCNLIDSQLPVQEKFGLEGETITFAELQPGDYKILGEVFQNEKMETLLYKGEADALVVDGEETSVELVLKVVVFKTEDTETDYTEKDDAGDTSETEGTGSSGGGTGTIEGTESSGGGTGTIEGGSGEGEIATLQASEDAYVGINYLSEVYYSSQTLGQKSLAELIDDGYEISINNYTVNREGYSGDNNICEMYAGFVPVSIKKDGNLIYSGSCKINLNGFLMVGYSKADSTMAIVTATISDNLIASGTTLYAIIDIYGFDAEGNYVCLKSKILSEWDLIIFDESGTQSQINCTWTYQGCDTENQTEINCTAPKNGPTFEAKQDGSKKYEVFNCLATFGEDELNSGVLCVMFNE